MRELLRQSDASSSMRGVTIKMLFSGVILSPSFL